LNKVFTNTEIALNADWYQSRIVNWRWSSGDAFNRLFTLGDRGVDENNHDEIQRLSWSDL